MTNQTHIDIVKAGFEASKGDDEILRELFNEGVEFADLRPTFNEIVSSEGLRLSTKERKIKADELLEDWVPANTEDLLAKVSLLKDELKVTDAKALGAIRSWAKSEGVDLPKAPRKAKIAKIGFGGHIRKILDCVKGKRDATRADIEKFCKENEVPVNYATTVVNIVDFAKEWNAEEVEASDED